MPSTGCFDDNFDVNMSALVAAIESAISAARPSVSRPNLTRMGSIGQDDATDAQIMQQLMQILSDTNCTGEELIAAAGDLRFMTRTQGGMHQALELEMLDTVLVPLLLDRSADVAEQALEVIQNLSGPSDNTSISGTFCIRCLHHITLQAT